MRGRAGTSTTIGLRLALAFVVVAVLAVGLVAALAAAFGEHDLSTLVQQRRDDLTRSLLADAASTYSSGAPGWSTADLRPAVDLAASAGANLAVLDTGGRPVVSTIVSGPGSPDTTQNAILLNGARIGTLVLQFTGHGLAASANSLKASLLGAVVGAAGLAAVLALVVALLTSRRLTGPIVRLIDTARALGAGQREARVGPVRAPGEIRELAVSFDSMADTLVREEALRRELVADVAHELRTPVAVLQASCEAMLDGLVDPTPEQIASLHDEVLRVARMVDDLQTLAAAEAAALHLSLSGCDLGEIADNAADGLSGRFAEAGVALERDITPTPVSGDRGRLHQVISNLLTNALKFTPAGGRVRLSVGTVDGRACARVSDTGIGIPEEEQPLVWDRFWRGRQVSGVPGSGIGLAVVAELVRAHSGRVHLTSAPGEGTTVTVSLPLGR